LFFDHSDNLRKLNLRYAHGSQLKEEFFQKWLEEYPDPSDSGLEHPIWMGEDKRHIADDDHKW
jgi:hypothetical protein